jgi:parallel beta-helix repeat protein
VKLTNSTNAVIKNNLIADNLTNGLWFDVYMYQVKVTGNTIRNNGSNGLEIELSNMFTVADNNISGNGETGFWTFDSGDIDAWNNTLTGNVRSIAFWQDERRNTSSTTTPGLSRNINVHNNVVVMGTDFCPILTQDETNTYTGNQLGVTLDNNVYQRPSTSSPSRWACWANGKSGIAAYYDMPSFQSATGQDRTSVGYTGQTPITDSNARMTSSTQSGTANVAAGLPASVASAIGQPTGTKQLGAFSAPIS